MIVPDNARKGTVKLTNWIGPVRHRVLIYRVRYGFRILLRHALANNCGVSLPPRGGEFHKLDNTLLRILPLTQYAGLRTKYKRHQCPTLPRVEQLRRDPLAG